MKLAQLSSDATTSLSLTHPISGEDLGVVIHGYTPDSKEWSAAQKEVMKADNKKMSMIIEKNQNRIELDSDIEQKKTVLLAKVVTGIDGLDDYKHSEQAAIDMFTNPAFNWVREQWADHLDDRANFFAKPARAAKSGSKS